MRSLKQMTWCIVLVASGALLVTACGHAPAATEEQVSPRTFSEFELVEARDNRERLRTLNQLKAKRASAD